MHPLTQTMVSALVIASTALCAGCGSGGGVTTSSAAAQGDQPGINNDDPMARPVAVAWTAARAKRCGFYFDPGKLRTAYLGYETKQGAAGESLAKIQKSYDTTFQVISDRINGEADYCSEKKGADIKADLQRHLAGDYTPNIPKPKVVAQCGGIFSPCDSGGTDEPFSSTSFWKKVDSEPKRR